MTEDTQTEAADLLGEEAPAPAKVPAEDKPAKAPKGKTYVVAIASIVERVKDATVTHVRGDVCLLAKAEAEALIARGDARAATAGDLADWREANR